MRFNLISVDDTALTTLEITGMLKNLNVNIINARNDQEAFDILNEKKVEIHAVIWTIRSMDTESFAAIKKLKSKDIYKHIPVIIVSQITDKKFIIKAIECGATEYIAKPYDEETVVKKMCKVLGVPYEKSFSRTVEEDILTFNFTEMLNKEIKAAGRGGYPLSILMVSLVNPYPDGMETLAEVNQLTQLVCHVLRTKLRETDTCFLYGIDSMILLLPFADRKGAKAVDSRIREIYEKHSVIRQKKAFFNLITSSVSYPEDGKIKDKLLEKLEESHQARLKEAVSST